MLMLSPLHTAFRASITIAADFSSTFFKSGAKFRFLLIQQCCLRLNNANRKQRVHSGGPLTCGVSA